MLKRVNACVLLAAGINRDMDATAALISAGAQVERIHINSLAEKRGSLKRFDILMLPGGFSFGDDIASGKVLAGKLKNKLLGEVLDFIAAGKLIFGVCNGFQVMVKLGLLPGIGGDYASQRTTLTFNDSGKFEDRWVYLKVDPASKCVFTKGMDELIYVPVCHGEGKFMVDSDETLSELKRSGQVALRYVDRNGQAAGYPHNPNGSIDDIAGISDPSGHIFGMMPHPEDFILDLHHPTWTRDGLPSEGAGLKFFQNAVTYVRENL
ncbi:MAG: phosphoribosylformylglycinamidine synthase I [Actinomycetota bacterium]|nr:phosphoribosylformylglycinamidine synthase I [Actinomycetota bacterium]